MLSRHDPADAQLAGHADRMTLLIKLVRDNAAKGIMVSKTKFAKLYGDPKGVFKLGINRLDALIVTALTDGYLSQGPLPQRYWLQPTSRLGSRTLAFYTSVLRSAAQSLDRSTPSQHEAPSTTTTSPARSSQRRSLRSPWSATHGARGTERVPALPCAGLRRAWCPCAVPQTFGPRSPSFAPGT